jgi:hypothetical protein
MAIYNLVMLIVYSLVALGLLFLAIYFLVAAIKTYKNSNKLSVLKHPIVSRAKNYLDIALVSGLGFAVFVGLIFLFISMW